MTVISRRYVAGPNRLLLQASVKSDLKIENNDPVKSGHAHAHQFESQGNMAGVALISEMCITILKSRDKPVAVICRLIFEVEVCTEAKVNHSRHVVCHFSKTCQN